MPTAHTSQTPASGDVANGNAITTGVRFIVADATPITAIAFYVPVTNTGTYTGGLWITTSDDSPDGSGTGTLQRSASIAAGSLTGGAWGIIPITSFTPSTGVVYTAGVHSSSGRIVSTGAGLASAITAGGVTLLAAGTDPNPPALGSMTNGVFVENAALAYPVSSFNTSDYFIDVERSALVTGTGSAILPAVAGTALGVVESFGTMHVTLGAVAGAMVSADAVAPVSRGGNWEDLISILDNNRIMKAQDDARLAAPVYCPNDQVTLMTGGDGSLFCPFDGWRPGR